MLGYGVSIGDSISEIEEEQRKKKPLPPISEMADLLLAADGHAVPSAPGNPGSGTSSPLPPISEAADMLLAGVPSAPASVPAIDRSEHGNNMALNLNVPDAAKDPLHIGAAAQNAYWNLQESKGNTQAMRAFQLEQAKRENSPGEVVAVNRSGVAPMTPVEEAVMLRQMAAKDRGDTEQASGLEKSFDYRVDELKDEAKRLWESAEKGRVKYDLPDNKFGAAILQTIESSGMTVEAALRSGALWALGGPALGLMGSFINTATEADYEAGEAFMTALKAGKSPEEIQDAVNSVRKKNLALLSLTNPLGDVLLFGLGKPLKALAGKIAGKGLLAKAGRAVVERGVPYVLGAAPEGVEGGSQEAFQQQAAGQDLDWEKIKEAAGSEALASLLYGLVGRGIRGGAKVLLGSQADSDGGKPGEPPAPPPGSGETSQTDGKPLSPQERVRSKLLELREKIFSSYLGPDPRYKGAAPALNWDNMSAAMKKQVVRLRKAMELWDEGKYDESERLASLLKDEMMPEKDTPLWAPVEETAETAEPSMPISEAADQVLADTSIPASDTSGNATDTSTPMERVKGKIRGQLEAIAAQGGEQAQVLGSEEIDAYSTLFAAMAEQAGKRQGISAEEWLESQNLKIVNGRPQFEASSEGTKLDQPLNEGVDPESTMTGFVAQPRFTAEQALELRSGKRRVEFIKSVSGKYQNEDTGWNINLSNKNVSHAIASAVKNNEVDLATSMNILAELPKIIQNARLVESHEDQKQKGYVDKIHRFFVPSKISNDPKAMYKVKLTVKELAGHFETSIEGIYRAYDTRIIEKVSERRHRKGLKDQPLNSHTPDTFEIILGPFLEGVNDSKGNPYIEAGNSPDLKQNVGESSEQGPVADEVTTRGSTLFGKGRVTITLGKAMDRTTLVHEFGHLFLADLFKQAKAGVASAIRDLNVLMSWWTQEASWLAKWISVNKYGTFTAEQAARFAGKDGAQLVRDALAGKADPDTAQVVFIAGHEMFARGFERYLSDGKAPNSQLRAVFERFKTWMAEVYGKLAGDPNFKLSKDAREVMERMVGGENAAAQAGTAENVSVARNGNETMVTLNDMELFQGARDESGKKISRSVSENIARGKRAMENVIRDHTDAIDAMIRDDIGSVSFYWGTPGTGSTFKGGSGVSHIIAKRNSEGINGEETARKMVDVIGRGDITKTEGPEKGTRVTISKDGYSAVLSLYRMGEKNTWLLTGWKDWDGNENSPGVNEEVYDSSRTTLPEPTRFQFREGAGEETNDILFPEGKFFQSSEKSSEKKKTKQQQALTHKAEDTEQARKLTNAPENPWPDEGTPISEQDIEEVFGTRSRATKETETPWPGEGENVTEADIDEMFSEGSWSPEGFSSAVQAIDDFFTPEKKHRGGEKGPNDPKNRERYDKEGNLLSENTKEVSYLNPIYTLTSPSLLAKKNKLFAPFFKMAKEAQELQETLRRDFNAVLDKAWGSLSEDQSQALNEILIEGDLRGRTFTDLALTARGLDEDVRRGYSLIRDLSDRVGKAVRQRQRDSGTKVMGWREGYVPHIFHGFFIRLEGRIVDTARSLQEAVELARNVEKDHPGGTVDIASKPNDFSGSSAYNASALNDRKLLKFSTSMEEAFAFTPDEAERFLKGYDKKAFKNRIFAFSHERLGVKGWDQDMKFAFRHYVNQSARFLAMDELKYKGIGLFEKTWGNFNHEYSQLADYTKKYLNDELGVPSNASRMMNEWFKRIPGMYKISKQVFGDRPAEYLASVFTKGMGVAKLGFFNISSAMMNYSQLVNASSVLGYRDLGLGLREYFSNLRNPSERVMRIYEETGVLDNLNVSAGAGYSKASEKLYGTVGRFLELSMAPFAYMDGMCRKATVLAAYNKAHREGKGHKDAIAYAKEINDRANFNYSIADTPAFIRRSGPLGQVAFQFKKFGIKQLEFAIGLNGFAENARFWIPMIALSGLWGFPGAELLKSLFMALFDRDPQAELNAWMAKEDWIPEPVRRTIQYGLLSNAGIDISKRVGMGDVIPNELADLLGPTVGTIHRMAPHVATLAGKLFGLEGDGTAALLNALEALSPGLSNPIKAILGEVEDKKRGRLKFRYQGSGERAVRAMGFRPTREAVESDAVRAANYLEAKRLDREREAIDEYVRARDSGSTKDAAKALARLKELKVTPDRIIRELRERKKGTAYERLQQKLKGQKSQEARKVLQGF